MLSGEKPLTSGLSSPAPTLPHISSAAGLITFAQEQGVKTRPFDINELIIKLGNIKLEVGYNMDSEIAGSVRFDPSQNQWVITYNDIQSEPRRRFTLAHELGHIFLHGQYIKNNGEIIDKTFFRSNIRDAIEDEANNFAAELLMPLDEIMQLMGQDIRKVSALSEEFGVSLAAMSYRLNNCALDWVGK